MKPIVKLITVIFTLSFAIVSCTTSKPTHSKAETVSHGSFNANYSNHSGRYENCSACQRIRVSQENLIASLDNERLYSSTIDLSKIPKRNIVILRENYTVTVNPSKLPTDYDISKEANLKTNKLNISQNNDQSNLNLLNNNNVNSDPKIEGLGLAGFIIGVVGLFMPLVLGVIMCIIAVIFGAISLNKIKNNPTEYKGKGFAITSLVVGIVGLGILALLLVI